MTAVEKLIDQLTSVGVLEIPQGSNAITYIIEQAKEMEKKQTKYAYLTGRYESDKVVMSGNFYAEHYYNETFKQEE